MPFNCRFLYLGGEQKLFLQNLSLLPVVSYKQCQRTLRQALRDSYLRQFPRGISRGFICGTFRGGGKSACGVRNTFFSLEFKT